MLSVIVPMFDAEKYIEECINSILNQSYKDIELIIVDDGSRDNSLNLCRMYESNNNRVRVISQLNSGPSVARAKGLELAVGEYVTFVDADDFIDPISYILALEDMQSDIDVISFGIYRYNDAENIIKDFDTYDERIYNRVDIEKNIFPNMIWDKEKNRFGLDPALWSKIYKKELIKEIFDKVEPIDFHYGEDVAVVYPLIKAAKNISIHREIYYYHRQRRNGCLPQYIKDKSYLQNLFTLYSSLLKSMNDDFFREQIDLFYAYSAQLVKKRYGLTPADDCSFVFPFDKVMKGNKIIIYGAGNVGKVYINQLNITHYCEVVLWVDINYEYLGDDVKSPKIINDTEFDLIVIAIANIFVRENVVNYLLNNGIALDKII